MRLLEADENALCGDETLVASVSLHLPRKLIEQRFRQLLDMDHKGKPGSPVGEEE
jgi:hypothetical protein